MGFLDGVLGGGDDAAKYLKRVPVPRLEDLQVQLEQLVLAGELRPEEAETILLGPSAFREVQTDPRLRGTQMDSLAELRKIVEAGGLDARAKASLEDALATQRTETRGAREAISANARARGIGGSDLELVNQLIAQQGAATRGSRAAVDAAAAAEARRDAALAQQAQLAGNIRQQDFGEASTRAEADDYIDRWNAANRQSQVNQNVGARNDAQARNLGARQAVLDTNVGLRNQQQMTNRLQTPLDLYKLRTGQAGQLGQIASGQRASDSQRDQQLLLSGAATIGSLLASDERLKENIEPLDSRTLLHELAGATWDYRGSGEPGVGVMAQDMERTPMAGAVSERPDGMKQIDYGSLGIEPQWLSVLADLNKRLEGVEGRRRG